MVLQAGIKGGTGKPSGFNNLEVFAGVLAYAPLLIDLDPVERSDKTTQENERFLKDLSCLPDSMRIDDCFSQSKSPEEKADCQPGHCKVNKIR